MESLFIDQAPGAKCRTEADAFYERNGSRARARNEDWFLLARQDDRLVGLVRFCVEEGVPLLRTMMIDPSVRHRGVGSALLLKFAEYLEAHNLKNVYCLPYAHLVSFYAMIGFKVIDILEAPKFLRDRIETYRATGASYLIMVRPRFDRPHPQK